MTRRHESVASFVLLMTYFSGLSALIGGSMMFSGFVFGSLAKIATAVITVYDDEGSGDDPLG
jgi:hypothetical protein